MTSVNEDAIGVTELQRLEEAMANLTQCVRENATRTDPEGDAMSFGAAEKAVLEQVAAVSSAAMAATLSAWQPTAAEVEHDGSTWRRMNPTSRGMYFGLHGEIVIDRYLYREAGVRNGPTIVPLELRAGLVDGLWTPRAAEAVGHLAQALPSRDAEEIAATLGVLPYSRSSLHRCAESLGSHWGDIAHEAEETLVQQMPIPDEAATLSVSVDRVSLPMEEPLLDDDGKRIDHKIHRVFRMAYCGVLTLHDKEGKPLGSNRYGRMPRGGSEGMEDSLGADVDALLKRRPDLSTVGLADGAVEMQHMLDRILAGHAPKAVAIDKYHLLEKLADAVVSTGRDGPGYLRSWKADLDADDRAVEHIETRLRTWSLDYDDELPKPLYDALTYIDNNRERMRYASMRKAGLPVGSGHVEATCKTIVSVRMKRAGARWKERSGQAILNLRSLACSHRWRPAMDITLGTYVHDVKSVREAA